MKKILPAIVGFSLLANMGISQTILGIDVYNGNGSINWGQVAASGKSFAFVKATEGVTFNDASFTTNMTNGSNAGLVMGAYHFARPDNNSAINEANHFIAVAGQYIGPCHLPPVLDLEDPNSSTVLSNLFSSSALTTWVQTWLTTVYNATGVAPIVYTNSNYASYLTSSLNTSLYKLWIAKPNTSPTTPPTGLGIWNTWLFKQYSWTGSVSGISGDVDLNVYNGTLNDFNNLIDCGGSGNEDITVTNASVNMGTVACGNDIEVDATQVYSGNQLDADLPSFDLDYYLSTDCTLDGSDDLLGGDSSTLGSDEPSDDENAVLTIPAGIAAGNYYILFVADADAELSESNENNNVACVQISVTCNNGGTEDITVTNASVSISTVDCGNDIEVEAVQVYSGNQLDADLPSFDLDYYLSTDCNLDGGDEFLGGDNSTLGSDDPSNTESATLTIPTGVSTGNYYILFVGDAESELSESNENNNVACVPITVNCGGGGSCNHVPSDLEIDDVNDDEAMLNWVGLGSAIGYSLRYREIGGSWITINTPGVSEYTLSSLSCGTTYEWQVATICQNGTMGAYSSISEFTTDACTQNCPTPNTSGTETSGDNATFLWNPVNNASGYEIRYKKTGNTSWIFDSQSGFNYFVDNLDCGQDYEWQVRTQCDNTTYSAWSFSQYFTTLECSGIQNEPLLANFKLFPNPNKGQFTIELNGTYDQETEISIIDIAGRNILSVSTGKFYGKYVKTININPFASGIYYVRVSIDNRFLIKKIIIEKE